MPRPEDTCSSDQKGIVRGLRLLFQSFQNRLGSDRHVAHAHSDCVIDCIGDRRRDDGGCWLADAARVVA